MRPTLRVSLLTTLFFTAYTGVVMASSTACQVAVVQQLRSAQSMLHRQAHHSRATLARWKIGAAAWSKAHGGKVYAGVPTPRHSDWTPLRLSCDNVVALDLSRPDEGLLLAGEALPEYAEFANRVQPRLRLDLAAAKPPPPEDTWEQSSIGSFGTIPPGGIPASSGGTAPEGSVGSASFPPAPAPSTLTNPVPAPESPTIVLLGTGMLSFLVSRLRSRTVL